MRIFVGVHERVNTKIRIFIFPLLISFSMGVFGWMKNIFMESGFP